MQEKLDRIKNSATKVTVVINVLTILSMAVSFIAEPSRMLNRTTATLATFAGLLNIFLLVVYDNLGFTNEGRFSLGATRDNFRKNVKDRISETADLSAVRKEIALLDATSESEGDVPGIKEEQQTSIEEITDSEDTAGLTEEVTEEKKDIKSEGEEAALQEDDAEDVCPDTEENSQEQKGEGFDMTGLFAAFDSVMRVDVESGSYDVFDPSLSADEGIHHGDDFYSDIQAALLSVRNEQTGDELRDCVARESLGTGNLFMRKDFIMKSEGSETPSRISVCSDGITAVLGLMNLDGK